MLEKEAVPVKTVTCWSTIYVTDPSGSIALVKCTTAVHVNQGSTENVDC